MLKPPVLRGLWMVRWISFCDLISSVRNARTLLKVKMPWHTSWGDTSRDPPAPAWLGRRRKSFHGFAFPFGLLLERKTEVVMPLPPRKPQSVPCNYIWAEQGCSPSTFTYVTEQAAPECADVSGVTNARNLQESFCPELKA